MEIALFLLVTVFAIVRAIYQFIRWAIRTAGGGTAMGRPPAPSPMSTQAPMPQRQPVAARVPMPQPSAAPQRRTEEAREFRPLPERPGVPASASLSESADAPRAVLTPDPAAWLTSPDALVRAVILQEVLGPPLARRRHRAD